MICPFQGNRWLSALKTSDISFRHLVWFYVHADMLFCRRVSSDIDVWCARAMPRQMQAPTATSGQWATATARVTIKTTKMVKPINRAAAIVMFEASMPGQADWSKSHNSTLWRAILRYPGLMESTASSTQQHRSVQIVYQYSMGTSEKIDKCLKAKIVEKIFQ